METQMQSGKNLHPLAWAAGIAVIVFSAAGVGAMMGWLPNSIGSTAATTPLAVAPAATIKPSVTAKAQVAAPHHSTNANSGSAGAPVRTAAACIDCGVIESVKEVAHKGEGSGLGAVGGAVVGGLVGSQVGGGRGKDVMMVVGAVGGGLAGNEVEKRVKSTTIYAITVRLDDGSARVVNQAVAPSWRAGDKVKFVNGAIQTNS